jgi:hypothetical protein
MAWLSRSPIVLALVLCSSAPVRAAGGERHLGPAALYVSVRLQSGYDALAEIRKILPKRMQTMLPMIGMGLSRQLGFDPLSAAWIDAAGVDATAPAWLSLFSLEPAAVRARLSRVEQAARRHLASPAHSQYFKSAEVAGPLAWVRHRVVLKLKDEAKTKTFLGTIASSLGDRALLLQGKSKSELAPALASSLGLTAGQAAAMADTLLGRNVLLATRTSPNEATLYRIVDGSVIVDLIAEAVGVPEKPGDQLKAAVIAALQLPKRSAVDLGAKSIGRRLFTDDAAAAVLLVSKPMLAAAAELDSADTLRSSLFGATPDSFGRRLKDAQACRKLFAPGSVPVGDLGFQLRGDSKGLHGRVVWAAPAAVTRVLTAASSKRDLIDVTEWQSKVAGLAGVAVEIGALLKALPRGGPFKLTGKAFEEKARTCGGLANATLLLGGWVGMLGLLKAEAKDQEQAALLLEHARSGVLLLRDLSNLSRPSLIAQVGVTAAGAAKLKDSVGKLAHEYGRPEKQTLGGNPTTIYPYLKAPLWGYSLGVTDLKKEGLALTLSTSRWELPGFLGQAPPTTRVLPARILAFAHGQLPKVLLGLQSDPSFKPMGKLLRDTAARLDELGANLSIVDGLLIGEVHVGLKQP